MYLCKSLSTSLEKQASCDGLHERSRMHTTEGVETPMEERGCGYGLWRAALRIV